MRPLGIAFALVAVAHALFAQETAMASKATTTRHSHAVEYEQLRRGTTMKFVYELYQDPVTGMCINLAEDTIANRIAPKIEFDPDPGLNVSAPALPTAKAKSELKDGPAQCATRLELKMNIHATEALAPGEYHVRGRIEWQIMGAAGPLGPESKILDIPVQVVERKAKVERTGPFQKITALQVLEAIAVSPFALGYALVCGAAGGCAD